MVSEGSRGSQEGCFGDKSGVSSELGSEVCSHGGDFMELGGTGRWTYVEYIFHTTIPPSEKIYGNKTPTPEIPFKNPRHRTGLFCFHCYIKKSQTPVSRGCDYCIFQVNYHMCS